MPSCLGGLPLVRSAVVDGAAPTAIVEVEVAAGLVLLRVDVAEEER
jgi:hypothetical protein